jgi:hypothetical protein
MDRRILNLEELEVLIDGMDSVDHLLGFFTSCRNIRKFTLRTWQVNDADSSRNLRTILPIFFQLEELSISKCCFEYLNEVFGAIFSSCPNLRKLEVGNIFVEDAENYFHNSNIIICAPGRYNSSSDSYSSPYPESD